MARGNLRLELRAVDSAPAAMRHALNSFLTALKIPEDRRIDIVTASGEALANAVEHAYLGAKGDFNLRLSLREGKVLGEVQDLGAWRDCNPAAERGRGLAILRATTQQLELNRSPHGTTVTFAV